MAKTNFQYEKRQRELEKKKKAEEKARRKLEAKHSPDGATEDDSGTITGSEQADSTAPTQQQQA
jgi:hypothetical protein